MKGLRSIPKILKINEVQDFAISCLFNNGESRIIDFKTFFAEKKITAKHPAYKLMQNLKEFQQVKIIGNTLGWSNTGIHAENFDGEEEFYSYDIDPIVLFQNSVLDQSRNLSIGKTIKSARKKAGLTQQQLAEKSGTTKHYISKLENNKSDIELLTLKKIIEAGLGKELSIQIV